MAMSMLMSVFRQISGGKAKGAVEGGGVGGDGLPVHISLVSRKSVPALRPLRNLHCRHTCSTAISLSISNAIYEGMRVQNTHTRTGKGRDRKDKNDARKGYRMSLILLLSFDYLMVVVR